MKCLILFLQHDQDKYPASFFYLQKYLENITCEKEIIHIDNNGERKPKLQVDNTHYIGGDNSLWEWSGWQKGIEYAKANNIEADAYLFVNDSFVFISGETFMFYTMSDFGIKQCIDNQTIVGDLCQPPQGIEIDGKKIKNYIRTHCFLLPEKMVKQLKTIWSTDKLVSTNNVCSEYMINHLTNKWHRRKEVGLYQGKIVALQNEMLLSYRVVQL